MATIPRIPRVSKYSSRTNANQPQACCWPSLMRAPIHITSITRPHRTMTTPRIVAAGGGLLPAAPRDMTPTTMPVSTATIHAPMYHRVVIDLLTTRLLAFGPDSLTGETRPRAPVLNEPLSRLAGAEGFEPSALGFGDRCSDQTELRPYAPLEFYPTPSGAPLGSISWPSSWPTSGST